jgi:hypothetical protein
MRNEKLMDPEPRREQQITAGPMSSDSAFRAPHPASEEPVRVKLYGLFSRTRRRYVVGSILELGYAAALLIVWVLAWPHYWAILKGRGDQLPTSMMVTVAVLKNLPLIMVAAVAIKAFEMWIVLRLFARKEAERLAAYNQPSPPA